MDEETKYFRAVAKDIESGQFFVDAKRWYGLKYFAPVTERTHYVVLTIVSVLTALVGLSVFSGLLPLVRDVPVAVWVQDKANKYVIVKDMQGDNSDEDPNVTLMRYILMRYIQAFESYDHKNNFYQMRERNTKFINRFSDEHVQAMYNFRISVSNPESIILKYKKDVVRKLKINPASIQFRRHPLTREIIESTEMVGDKPYYRYRYTALADFSASELSVQGESKSAWRAKIDFIFPDITYNEETGDFLPFEFSVTDYQSMELVSQ